MGPIKLPGLIVGGIGNALMAWALYSLLGSIGCEADAPVCTPAIGASVAALPIGIILSVIGVFLGGGVIIFTGVFASIGLGSLAAAAFTDMGEMELFGWLFGGGFFLFGLMPLLGTRLAGAAAARKQALAERLAASGRRGIGTIVAVNDTGVTINDNPRVEIVVSVDPIGGGPAIERRKKAIVSRVAIPRVGSRFPVFYDAVDATAWIMAMEMDETTATAEVRDLFARAGRGNGGAPSPGDAGLVGELERLSALRDSGALSAEEFARAKSALLGG